MAGTEWQTSKPSDKDKLSELATIVSSQRSQFDAVMQSQFYWADSTASAGIVRLSHASPGGWRGLYGPRSQVSDPGREGLVMLVSDESRMLVFMSGTSYCFASDRIVLGKTFTATPGSDTRMVVDSGKTTLGAAGDYRVPFNVQYTGQAPEVLVQAIERDTDARPFFNTTITSVGSSSFSCNVAQLTGSNPSSCSIYWRSEGTMALV